MRAKCIKSLELNSEVFVEGQFYEFEVETFCIPDVCRQMKFTLVTNYYGPKTVFYDRNTCKKEQYPYCFEDYFVNADPHIHFGPPLDDGTTVNDGSPLDDMKACVDKALNSSINPFAVRARLEENYKKKVLEGKLKIQFKKEMKMSDRTLIPCTWRKDKGSCILTEARLIRWLKPAEYDEPKMMITILRPGDMYIENTDYIPLAELLLLPQVD